MEKGKRIGLDTIGRGQFAGRPLQQHVEPAPATSADEPEPLKDQRWLYDDENEFKRAQKKVASEIAREKAKKELAKKARIAKAKQLLAHGKTTAKKVAAKGGRLAAAHAKTAFKKPGTRKKILIAVPVIAAALLLFSILSPRMGSNSAGGQVAGDNTPATPTFSALMPDDDAKNVNNGKVAFDKSKQVASFIDTIGETPVTVSQQPLPERFKNDPLGELGKFAEEINAKDKIVADKATGYSGVSIKGPQTTVLIKEQLLLFITADTKLTSDELTAYINSLK